MLRPVRVQNKFESPDLTEPTSVHSTKPVDVSHPEAIPDPSHRNILSEYMIVCNLADCCAQYAANSMLLLNVELLYNLLEKNNLCKRISDKNVPSKNPHQIVVHPDLDARAVAVINSAQKLRV